MTLKEIATEVEMRLAKGWAQRPEQVRRLCEAARKLSLIEESANRGQMAGQLAQGHPDYTSGPCPPVAP